MKEKNRIEWIDVLRGIGIVLVILGHAPRDLMRETYPIIDCLYQFIYTFHMGLFFSISGYLFAKKSLNIKKLLKNYYYHGRYIVFLFI